MPMYEYYCRTCNEKFTKLRPITEAAEPWDCHCGEVAQKVLTAAVVAHSGRFDAIEAAEAAESMPSGGGCACGRNSCGCGSGGHGGLN